MTLVPPSRVKKFTVFLNGDENFSGKTFVYNQKKIPDWNSLLDNITSTTRARNAVRSIRTPTNGSMRTSFDQLEENQNYVAVGGERFKKLNYSGIKDAQLSKKQTSPRFPEPANDSKDGLPKVKPVLHSRIQVSGRIRKIKTDGFIIHVFKNGDPLRAPARILLRPITQTQLPLIISDVEEKIKLDTGPVLRLCTLDGQEIREPGALVSNGQYVAVGHEPFKHRNYSMQRVPFNISPKRDLRRLDPIAYPTRRSMRYSQRSSQQSSTMETSGASTGSSDYSQGTNKVTRRRRKPDPFHARSEPQKRSSEKTRQVDYDKDDGGVFKAKGRRQESRDAQEIQETNDTQVDLPIDQVEAEEVKVSERSRSRPRCRSRSRSRAGSRSRSPSYVNELAYV